MQSVTWFSVQYAFGHHQGHDMSKRQWTSVQTWILYYKTTHFYTCCCRYCHCSVVVVSCIICHYCGDIMSILPYQFSYQSQYFHGTSLKLYNHASFLQERDGEERFCFIAEWYDPHAAFIRRYQFMYYVKDGTVEMVWISISYDFTVITFQKCIWEYYYA